MGSKKTPEFYYAMGLHMHQPPDNLQLLIDHNEWEAQQIIRCYERAARYALKYPKETFHVDFSGVLLEQFLDPGIIDKYRRFVDIPKMLDDYKKAKNIELIGMGYYHPIFPLIPKEDWPEQLQKGKAICQKAFGRAPKGFWPSEMAFCMEMIPELVKAGYEFVIVDHVHVHPVDGSPLDPFKPYTAEHNGARIIIIPRNRDLSNAQESGLNPKWFMEETGRKLSAVTARGPRLVTTWSDGENGGWFRQIDDNAGFFGYFWESLIKQIQSGAINIKTTSLSEYLKMDPPVSMARVNTGAWNVASTSGYDFAQWNGSETQKKAIEEVCRVSKRYWDLSAGKPAGGTKERLAKARKALLEAETSCYLFWGDAWLPKLYEKLKEAERFL